MINTSPEPFTNWAASVGEDIAVFAGLCAALNYPVAFIAFLVLFIIFLIWFLPKIWRSIKLVFLKIGEWLGLVEKQASQPDALDEIAKLKQLLDDGAITQEEFDCKKTQLLGTPLPK